MATNIEAVLATIRQMESGGNYSIQTRGGSDACGAYQYISSTWQGMLQRTMNAGQLPRNTPFYSRACYAPKNVQDAVARYDVTSFLGSVGDNRVDLVPIHWYYPAAIATWPSMAGYVPPGNSISLGDYQRKWLQTYSVFAKVPISSLNESQATDMSVNSNTGIQYSYAQLEQIWINAGGNPQVANIAAAVAMAESSGNPNAVSASNDYGLWQINSVHGAQATLDVMANARAAVSISNNGQNWGPWCTCWVNPNGNCGHFLGPNPQPGSPAANNIRTNIPPDTNVSVNGTAAATAQPTGSFVPSIGGCNALEWMIDPGGCAAGNGPGKIVGSASTALANGVINLIVGSVINPLISIVAGVLGMGAGVALMIIALYMLFKDSAIVQGAKGIAETAAVSAVAPELAPVVGTEEAKRIHDTRQAKRTMKTQMQSRVSSSRQQHSKRFQEQRRREAIRNQARQYKPSSVPTNGSN